MQNSVYDVIVAGGGTAGIAAAVSSARLGAKTLLIEQNSYLGGTAVTGIPILGMYDGCGKQAAGGFAAEFVRRLVDEGGAVGPVRGARWSNRGHMQGDEFILTPFDSEIAKYAAQEMVLEAGTDMLLHTFITGVNRVGNTVTGLDMVNKSGFVNMSSPVIIDATGDADVCALSGAELVSKQRVQNATILFVLQGVDTERLFEALKRGDHLNGWGKWHSRTISAVKLESDHPSPVHIAGHVVPWDDEAAEVTFTAVSVREHEVYLNATRTVGIDGTDAGSLTRGEISERRNIHRLVAGLRAQVPGFEKAFVSRTGPIGIRESRTVVGDYLLTAEDVLEGKVFPDRIARGAYPSDIHDPEGGRTQFLFIKNGGSYTIPYRCLLPKGIEGLLVAGRSVSADQTAGGSVRLQATVMAQGQAAGTAAAMASRMGTAPRAVLVEMLQQELRRQGAVL